VIKLRWTLLLFFIPFLAKSQVQTSGYISLKWLGGTSYQATVVDYTQGNPSNNGACGSGGDPDSISLSWGDGNYEVIYRSNGTGDSVCACRKSNIYVSKAHTYSGPATYTLWVDFSDYMPSIVNMGNSANTNMFIKNVLTLTPVAGYNVFSPVITNLPVCTYGCLGQCYTFNLGADTAGGDSLTYSLGNINAPGYYIPKNANINPVTGTLSWCNPDSVGLYEFLINIVTYKHWTFDTTQFHSAVDTEEVILQVNIQDSCVLGINEITNKSAYNIYPNPAGNMVYINGGNETNKLITVYDLLGQSVISTEEKQEEFAINTSGLNQGVYFVNIKEEQTGRSYTLKLVKN
jgi:type IX secretion system substrate protein